MGHIMCSHVNFAVRVVLVKSPDSPVVGTGRVQSDDRTASVCRAHRMQNS